MKWPVFVTLDCWDFRSDFTTALFEGLALCGTESSDVRGLGKLGTCIPWKINKTAANTNSGKKYFLCVGDVPIIFIDSNYTNEISGAIDKIIVLYYLEVGEGPGRNLILSSPGCPLLWCQVIKNLLFIIFFFGGHINLLRVHSPRG